MPRRPSRRARLVYTEEVVGKRVCVLYYNKDLGPQFAQYLIGKILRYNRKRRTHTVWIDEVDAFFNGMSGGFEEDTGMRPHMMELNLNAKAAKPVLAYANWSVPWLVWPQ